MTQGTLYGIGVGPGDPELITVKATRILSSCAHVFAPRARIASGSLALSICREWIPETVEIHELVYPMTKDGTARDHWWEETAEVTRKRLDAGEDVCLPTIGDPFLHSTWIYLVRAMRKIHPDAKIQTIPGIMAVQAAAAATEFPLGLEKRQFRVIPTADDLAEVEDALDSGAILALMKVGKRLPAILELVKKRGLLPQGRFARRVGIKGAEVFCDLETLMKEEISDGNLSVILIDTARPERR